MSVAGERLIRGLEQVLAHTKGEITLRTMRMGQKSADAASVGKAEIKQLRKEIGLTQVQFASKLGVSHKTVEAWECGRNKPSGASLRLLEIVRENPQVIAKYA